MIQYTRTYTRPSLSVPWWFSVTLSVPIADATARMNSQYYSTGKCIAEHFTVSTDRLTLTYIGIWATEADFAEYNADPVLNLYWAAKDEYNNANGVIKNSVQSSVI